MAALLTLLLAATQAQAQTAYDDADMAIKTQTTRLDAEKVAAYQSQAASLQGRYNALTPSGKMDAVDRSVYLTSYQAFLPETASRCANASTGLNGGKDVIGAIPQLAIAKAGFKPGGWDSAFDDANTALGWASYAQGQLDRAAALHAAIEAGLAKADAVLTKNGG